VRGFRKVRNRNEEEEEEEEREASRVLHLKVKYKIHGKRFKGGGWMLGGGRENMNGQAAEHFAWSQSSL
jgi:hypothetical protein